MNLEVEAVQVWGERVKVERLVVRTVKETEEDEMEEEKTEDMKVVLVAEGLD